MLANLIGGGLSEPAIVSVSTGSKFSGISSGKVTFLVSHHRRVQTAETRNFASPLAVSLCETSISSLHGEVSAPVSWEGLVSSRLLLVFALSPACVKHPIAARLLSRVSLFLICSFLIRIGVSLAGSGIEISISPECRGGEVESIGENGKQSALESLRLRRATDGKVKLIRDAFRVSRIASARLEKDSSPANTLKAARRKLKGSFPELLEYRRANRDLRRELSLVDRRYRWSTGN